MFTTFEQHITNLRAQINAQTLRYNQATSELAQLRTQDAPDAARVAELRSQAEAATVALAPLQADLATFERAAADDDRDARAAEERHSTGVTPPAPAGTTHERDQTYSRNTAREGVSFFRDMLASQAGGYIPQDVQARLQRHEGEIREIVLNGDLSERAISTGSVGGLVPPQYLTEQYAEVTRAGRPAANLVTRLPLPQTGMSVVVPKGTTGASVAVQATQNTNVSNTDAAFVDITAPVVTIAGQHDVSRQSLDRGENIDQIIFADMAGAYAVALNAQVLSGTGSNGQALGILNTAGSTQMSAFTAALTMRDLYKKIAGAINAVQTGRTLPPEAILMHPRRWAWLTAQFDGQERPLVVPKTQGAFNAAAVAEGLVSIREAMAIGHTQGLPVINDMGLPSSVGAGPEDVAIVARFSDHLLWEDNGGVPTQMRFEQAAPGSLTIKLVAYGYMAFTAARFPQSTALIGGNASAAGNGMVAPTF